MILDTQTNPHFLCYPNINKKFINLTHLINIVL